MKQQNRVLYLHKVPVELVLDLKLYCAKSDQTMTAVCVSAIKQFLKEKTV